MDGDAPSGKAKSYALEDIVADERFQLRPVHERTVRDYVTKMRAGEKFPPLVLGNIKGTLYLLCGWHRYAAASELNKGTLEAVEVETTIRQARWIAAKDNFRHGRPLTKQDKVLAFKAYMAAGGNRAGSRLKTYSEIRSDLPGVTKSSLQRWMVRLYPKVAKAMAERKPEWMDDAADQSAEAVNLEATRQAILKARALSRGVRERDHRADLERLAAELAKELSGTPSDPTTLAVPEGPEDF
jgi:hypothetical protein